MKKINLSADEWEAFTRERMEEDCSALQPCCANISALRDAILAISKNDGQLTDNLLANLKQKWEWCKDGHDFNSESSALLRKLITQAGLS